MAKYDLLLNAAATAAKTPPVPQGQAVKPWGPTNPGSPPQQQSFQVEVSGVGAVSASAQIVVSDDVGDDPSTYNWVPYGDPIVASGTNFGAATASMNACHRHFGAYLSALSGTNAKANVLMNA